MDTQNLSNGNISDESVAAAVEFAADFSQELQKYNGRLSGSEQEIACARAIRARLEYETDSPVRMEAFKARPSLGRGCFFALGFWFILSYALYYISFAGGRVAGILLTLVALVNFAVGGTIIMLLFSGNKKLSGILGKAVSYNVVSEFSKNVHPVAKERVIVIADCHDAEHGSVLKDYGLLRKLTAWICPICAFLFVLFCLLKMIIGTQEPNMTLKISLFTIIPAVSGVFGTTVALLHYSPLARHAKLPNGLSTCVAMATYAYFAEQPDFLPDDVRVVYASFGSENAAHAGEDAFIKAHPEFADAYVLCIGELRGDEFKIAESDPVRKLSFSLPLISAVSGAAHDIGVELSTVPHDKISQNISQLHGYPSTPFAKAGVSSATLLSTGAHADDEVARSAFLISVGAMFKLFDDIPAKKTDDEGGPAVSTDAKMQAISGK